MLSHKAIRTLAMPILLFLFIVILTINTSVFAAEPSNGNTKTGIFNTSDNTVKKCELFFSLKKSIPETGTKAPEWIAELLGAALNDKSPVVVADAVHLIGEFRLTEYTADLITLYKEVKNKFGTSGYNERVECAIITALGKSVNTKAKTFLSDLLGDDNGSYKGEYILSAIENTNDPVFINDIQQYKARMETFVANARKQGCDPFLYSVKSAYIKRAGEIGKSLLKVSK